MKQQHLPSEAEEPKYAVLQDILMQKIEAGEFLPGEKIPGERMIAEKYGFHRMTVKTAINALVEKKYLYRIQGKGTFVQKKDFHKLNMGFVNESGNSGITAVVKSQGVRISNEIITKGKLSGSRFLNAKLNQEEGDAVYALHRVRYGNEEPIAVEYTYLVNRYFEDIDQIDFKYVSLYDYMDAKGHMPLTFDQTFRIIESPQREAKHLKLLPGQIIYYFEFLGYDANKELVEYTESFLRTDKAEFHFHSNQ